MTEIWLGIKGYEGLYEISNHGRVKSLPRLISRSNSGSYYTKVKILVPQKRSNACQAYEKIDLSKNGKVSQMAIHRLVANAFIHNPDNKPCVNHINRNASDNRALNLEWCTHKENTTHWLKDSGKQLIKKEYKEVQSEYLLNNNCSAVFSELIARFNILLSGVECYKYGTIVNSEIIPNMIWKHIEGYYGFYIISEFGHVGSLPRTVNRQIQYPSGKTLKVNGFLLKQHISIDRFQVPISKNGVYKKLYSHKLVASAFIKQPPNSNVVNHKDGDKLNNHYSNLEWTTNSQNQLHCYKNKLRIPKSGKDHWRFKNNITNVNTSNNDLQ